MRACRVIYIYGPDGSGKSTICKELVGLLNRKGVRATYRWMRFNHYFSRAVNMVGRLTGLSCSVFYPDGTKVGYHHYYKSRIISVAYFSATMVDTFIATVFKLWMPLLTGSQIIVLDRFVFDTMADLSVDTKNPGFPSTWQGRLLRWFLPSKTVPVYIEVDKEVISERRPDTQWDETFAARYGLYQKIFDEYGVGNKVNNNGDIKTTLETIIELLKRDEEERSPVTI